MASTGRPAFKPTPAIRRRVEELVSCGMSQEECARAVGITKPTLIKHFPDELLNGVAKRRAEVIAMLYKQARKGNATCIKKLEEMSRIAGAAEAVDARSTPSPERQERLGKKQEQKLAAGRVGGKYAPPSAPKLVVDNR